MRNAFLLPLLAPLVAAIPAATPTPAPTEPAGAIEPRFFQHLDPTAVWISVDKSGKPSTVTPMPTTVSGSAAVVDPAPYALTGSLFVYNHRENGRKTTSTGEPPLPTAKNKKGKGAFAPCHRPEGATYPFCSPDETDEVISGRTYYVTFDASLPILKSNNTQKLKLRLLGTAVNETGELGDEVFASKAAKPAAHGFVPWDVSKKLVARGAPNATVHLSLQRLFVDEDGEEELVGDPVPGPTLTVLPPAKHDTGTEHGSIPAGAELYVALPIVFGVLLLAIIGSVVWARSSRRMRFGLGDLASSGRKGHREARMGRAQRMLNKMKRRRGGDEDEQGVQLLDRQYDDDDDEGHFAGQEGWGGQVHRRQSKEGYKES